jgi:hypothetical protein
MWKLFCSVLVLGLAACASRGPTVAGTERSDWESYRANTLAQRDQGQLSPVEAQERIESRYEELYGVDPVMEGAFAYGLKLYEAADAGDMSMAEADSLAQSEIDQALAHRDYTMPKYVFPPEASH